MSGREFIGKGGANASGNEHKLGRGLFKVILISGRYYKIWGKMVIRKMYSVKFEK